VAQRDLTPNDPRKRFEWVIKTYWSKDVVDRQPMSSRKRESLDAVVLDTFYVTTSLVGAHDLSGTAAFSINRHELGSPYIEQHAEEIFVERIQKRLDIDERPRNSTEALKAAKAAKDVLARLGQPYQYDAEGFINWDSEQWGLAELVLQVVKLPEHNPRDFLIPWIGRELAKLAKEVFKGARRPASAGALSLTEGLQSGVTASDYWDAVRALYDKAPAIAQWAKETRADVGKVDLAQALEAIATYEFKESLVEQGAVVYTFADDWTVQELRTPTALLQEGDQMQNCVGGYDEDVASGLVRIYSIRDKSGSPHVSMELRARASGMATRDAVRGIAHGAVDDMTPEEFIASPSHLRWHFEQILGKQNDMPVEAYRARAREFIDKVFDKEGLGWCIAGGAAKEGRFAGRQLNDINVTEIINVNGLGDGFLGGADFTDCNLTGAHFRHVNLGHVRFSKARLSEADFSSATLTGAQLDGAACIFTNFAGANLSGANFENANVGGAGFVDADLDKANFRNAKADGATFTRVKSARTANWEGVELTPFQDEAMLGGRFDIRRRAP